MQVDQQAVGLRHSKRTGQLGFDTRPQSGLLSRPRQSLTHLCGFASPGSIDTALTHATPTASRMQMNFARRGAKPRGPEPDIFNLRFDVCRQTPVSMTQHEHTHHASSCAQHDRSNQQPSFHSFPRLLCTRSPFATPGLRPDWQYAVFSSLTANSPELRHQMLKSMHRPRLQDIICLVLIAINIRVLSSLFTSRNRLKTQSTYSM
jgi:hypothetical protein